MPQKKFFLASRFSWPFILSVGFHCLLIAGLLYASLNSPTITLPTESQPINVVMVNPAVLEATPASRPKETSPSEPMHEPELQPKPVPEPVPVPLPEPKPKPKPRPVKKIKPSKPPIRQRAVEKQPPSHLTSDEPLLSANKAPVRQSPTVNVPSSGPRPLSRAQPEYPARAFALRIEGRVKLQFDVNASGRVDNVRVLSAEPKNMFERDIKQAMRKWRYEENKPAKDLVVTIMFKINGGAAME
ncbi:TonB system transport protein TonB [Prodigiosinella aquatilis]|nr:TonB system transport protein TonB [Prodigiosinella sp. LS101]WJV55817.1 TonB system transport protein TonB [Prodigiosinella sp. LS101]WJV60179.1 TonB system transport protein TonB [Pectobacteriaceae bacterium C111]